MYAEFDLHVPESLDGALAVLAENGEAGAIMPLAGGTNMIVDLRARSVTPAALVSIGKVPGIRGIAIDGGRVRMGGRTTVSDMLRNAQLRAVAPSLLESAGVFAGQMVRNTATVAGNICSGSPAADLVPPLLALDADVTLTSRSGSRTLALADFFHGYKQMARRSDELLTEVSWPVPNANASNQYYKLARRKGDAITVVGVAVALRMEDGRSHGVRIALASVAPIVMRAVAAERTLEGNALTDEGIEAASRMAMEESSPIDDIRASADYRRHCVHVLTRRLLTQARDRLDSGGSQS
ncbi:MAG: xanthine dehydrogenase family protein subunit M [Lysobacterales bacterium]|nr:MAG: xanthine dehydrogenase family protein subunit M [Xanthomonadales bacterium]